MNYTHLDLCQNILSALDSDEVDAWDDTVESRQVGELIRTTYFNIIARSQLPEHKQIVSLTASGDNTKPCLMYKPSNVSKIEWLKYDTTPDGETAPQYNYVTFLPLEQFLDYIHEFNPDSTDVDTMSVSSKTFLYNNNKKPEFYTILEDYYIVFDSYDSDVDTTLQATKTLAFAQTVPTYTLDDTFTPDLDEHQMMLLLNEAKSLAFMELKQMSHQKAEQEARRQWSVIGKKKHVHDESNFNQLPNFGRMSSRAGYSKYPVGFFRER